MFWFWSPYLPTSLFVILLLLQEEDEQGGREIGRPEEEEEEEEEVEMVTAGAALCFCSRAWLLPEQVFEPRRHQLGDHPVASDVEVVVVGDQESRRFGVGREAGQQVEDRQRELGADRA